MSFKLLLIFPFQYLAEQKENSLSRFFNLKISIYQHNISIYQYIPGLPLVKKINQLEPSIMLNKRYIKSIKRDIFCFDFLSSILVSISFLLYWKGKIRSGLNVIQGIASDTIPSHCTILLTGLIARWILIS